MAHKYTLEDGDGNVAGGSTSTSPQLPRLDMSRIHRIDEEVEVDERVPLLTGSIESGQGRSSAKGKRKGAKAKGKAKEKKPFYRARPLWLVPFALIASITRGMTLAPRVEVFTQLSCHRVYGIHHPQISSINTTSNSFFNSTSPSSSSPFPYSNLLHLSPHFPDSAPTLGTQSIIDGGPIFSPSSPDDDTYDPNDGTSDPRSIPSSKYADDYDDGLLSALTTGWDLVFILVSTPGSPLSKHGHILLLIAPIVEGALGGWSTLQATTSAYVSDCTSSGSRAHVFSRFTGVTYLGVFIGPSISGYLIQKSSTNKNTKNVTSVFWVAVVCSFVNFLLAVFVFPESLDEEKRGKAMEEWERAKRRIRERGKGKGRARVGMGAEEGGEEEEGRTDGDQDIEGEGESVGLVAGLIAPLAVFLPVLVRDRVGMRMRRDWSLTVLAFGYFGLMLCAGLYQLKYLYAEHVYGWGAEQLSWYISYLGGVRAIALLLVLPYVIGLFKPKPGDTTSSKSKGRLIKGKNKGKSTSMAIPSDGSKPKPTRSQLGREISFDLTLTRCSFLMDVVANLLIIASPAPTFRHTSVGRKSSGVGLEHSQALFVLASGMASFGTGAAPAIHSLTLCILQAREMSEDAESAEGQGSQSSAPAETRNVGGLFGAFAFLQSIGSMILGPMMFGLVYSSTVAAMPKAIFMVAAGMLSVSLLLMLLVRNPVQKIGKKRKRRGEGERGRSRVSKDLRGGAAGNAQAGPSSQPALYLPPQGNQNPSVLSPHSPRGPTGPPPPRQHLASTQDLLARFRLLPAYDKYVRPYATQYTNDGQIRAAPAGQSALDKGKGREQDPALPATVPQTPGTGPDQEEDEGVASGKDKKKKNSYKALIKGIPGKHSMKKDNYLTQTMLVPEKQRNRIRQFDARTQQEAFAVSLEGLKGWNVTTLIVESAQAREDRKKRKELKRLAKAQQAQAAAAMQAVAAGSSSPAVVQPQPLRGASAIPQISSSISSTPKPVGTPRPQSSMLPRPGSAVPRPGSTVPRPGSTVPRPSSTAPSINIKQEPVPSLMVSTPTSASSESLRGKKREREDGTIPVNGVPPTTNSTYMNGVVNGVGNGNGAQTMNAKAGIAGVRPRPMKKQRMDVQGQARDVTAPVQQPTPQGV
ncbi:hypothetical protein D9756_003450 [Leucocoprinus leucothites]|uniref:Uncharacterized protein n=1 Tax=Leucocoprinus leucothites TaxID=201217 RepID=A0A8H5LK01_9AGAR|nr:hypothetical protein D9756_003450 [Leucoagaricus leucothites]